MTHDVIDEFLSDYAERCAERGGQAVSVDQLRPILVSFVIAEQWQDPDPSRLTVAVRSLRARLRDDAAATSLLGVIEQEASGLVAKLNRAARANGIIYEHAIMLADQLHRYQASGDSI